jgi:hypothetical protein
VRARKPYAVPDDAKDKTPADAPARDSAAEPAAESEETLGDREKSLEASEPPENDGEEGDDEDDGAGEGDLTSPEAVARRVAVLGEDDDLERFARDEEAKLAERRKAQRKGKKKKKRGLEAAASKRLAKIGTKAPIKRALPTTPEADPLIERATQIGDWAKKNQGTVTALVGAAILAVAGLGVYTLLARRHEAEASVELAKAVDDEHGRIGDPDQEDEDSRVHDDRLVFKTVEERREAALRDYRAVESKFKGTGAAILARLSEGSLLLDKHDVAGAKSAFEEVRGSPLAKADAEVHGRALESLGFADELKADEPGGDRAAALEEASKVFRELENTDVKGFKELGMYHQARVLEKQGDKAKAVEMLKTLHDRLTQPGENHSFVYLEYVADERLRALDPTAIPPKPSGQLGGVGQNQLSQAQLRRMIEQAQKSQGQQGQGKKPGNAPLVPPMPPPEDLPP